MSRGHRPDIDCECAHRAYTADQVAARLNLSVRLVRQHTTEGWFPCHRIGRAVRYTVDDIEAYLAQWRDITYSQASSHRRVTSLDAHRATRRGAA